jgi:TRAP-type C4-dicarboxylate transport system permease small subunit
VTYLPIPLGGAILLLFVIERLTIGPPAQPIRETSAAFD